MEQNLLAEIVLNTLKQHKKIGYISTGKLVERIILEYE
jgi:hypothetical protein